MIRAWFISVVGLAAVSTVCAQQDAASKNFTHRVLVERLSVAGAATAPLTGTPLPPAEVVGDAFLLDGFAFSTFLLTNDQTTGSYEAKYDIERNVFYYKFDGKIYVLAGERVKSFYWFNPENKQQETFVSKLGLTAAEGIVLPGFLQVLADGALPLLKGTSIVIIDPNYNFSRAIGKQDYSVVKKIHLYYLEDGVVNVLPEGDKVMSLFGREDLAAILKFIEHNDFLLSEESELAEIFKYYNYRREQQ
jgi:hypothetical protein